MAVSIIDAFGAIVAELLMSSYTHVTRGGVTVTRCVGMVRGVFP